MNTNRKLTIHAETTVPAGRLMAVEMTIGDRSEHYAVTLGRLSAKWRKTIQTPEGRVFADPHTVSLQPGGVLGCTCPDRLYRGAMKRACKHMDATAALVCRKVVAVAVAG